VFFFLKNVNFVSTSQNIFILSLHTPVKSIQGWESNFIAPGLTTKKVSQLKLFRCKKKTMLKALPSLHRTLKATVFKITTSAV
jgi:hypothetical protein